MSLISVAAILLAVGVGLGAFGAHTLKAQFSAYQMDVWEKAVLYHFLHALGLLIVATLPKLNLLTPKDANVVGWLLVAGIAFFSGSLYVLALSGVGVLGAVTPLGGVCFIAAWFVLAFRALR